MKINKTIFFVFLIWFLIVNVFTFKNFFWLSYGNIDFKNDNFTWALDDFEKVDSLEGNYNKLNSNYRLEDYNNILENLEDCNEAKDCFLYYHNLWNTYFRLYEQSSSESSSKREGVVTSEEDLLKSSISSYLSALKIRYDEETEKNLEYVKYVLDDLKREEEEKQEQEENTSEEGNQGDEKTVENWEENKDWWEENSIDSEESSTENINEEWWEYKQLSESEKNTLEQYSKALEEWQKEFWKYYNKVYSESRNPVDEFEVIFWNDPLFDNSALDWRNEEKDW